VVIFRRWKVALPLLLVAIGATAYVAVTAKPDYVMTSYVQVIPAKVAPTDNPAAAALRNPWNQLGLATIAQAATYTTQDKAFLESLKAAGHTENFTLTTNYPNPIVTVQVVARTPADARETTDLVVTRLRNSVLSLQKQAAVQDQDLIATQRLDQGQNLETSGGKVKRALAAVAVAGLLMMAGGTLAFDALARRRSRRRQERAEASSPPHETAESGTVDGRQPESPRESGEQAAGPVRHPATVVTPEESAVRPAPPVGERTAIVVKRTASVVRGSPAADSPRPGEAVTYVSMNAHGESSGTNHDAVPTPVNGDAPAASDVRTVLQPQVVDRDSGDESA
jgi:hypothetical protein